MGHAVRLHVGRVAVSRDESGGGDRVRRAAPLIATSAEVLVVAGGGAETVGVASLLGVGALRVVAVPGVSLLWVVEDKGARIEL